MHCVKRPRMAWPSDWRCAREEARPENTAHEHDGKNGDQPLDISSYTCILVCYDTAGLSDTAGQVNSGVPRKLPASVAHHALRYGHGGYLDGCLGGASRGAEIPGTRAWGKTRHEKSDAALHPMHCVKDAAVPVRLASLATPWPAQNRPRIVDQSGSEVCQFSSVTHGTFLGRRPLVPPAQSVALVVLHKSPETPAGLPGR